MARRRFPLFLLAIAASLGAGAVSTPRAAADCHTVDPATKTLRKRAAALGKELTAAVRASILGLRKEGKALSKQVKKETMQPE